MSTVCFHCGLELSNKIYYLTITEVQQSFCCIGCQMVAQTIIENGLGNYYEFRDKPSASQQQLVPLELLELNQYNLPAIQNKYLSKSTEEQQLDSKTIILSVDGITCAACVWLMEKRTTALSGVLSFTINLTNHRAELVWLENLVSLSQVLLEIAKLGFRAQPFQINHEELIRKREYRIALKRLAISGFGFGQVMMFAAPLYDWFSVGIPVSYRDFFRIVSLVVTTPVLLYCGEPFFKSALLSLKSRLLSMDVSISLALVVVYIAGVYATIMHQGEVYFDSITMFLFFITLSRYLEMRARHYSSIVIQQLSHMQPEWVTKIKGDNISEVIPINELMVNEHIIIKSGAVIPVDGIVLSGVSCVNEALLTGEPLPKNKQTADSVIAGSINVGNPLTIKVTRVGSETTLATILKLLDRAQFDKPKIISITQQFSHYFVLVQMLTALLLFLFWLPVSVEHAFWTTISLLVISCPCALAIATPIALTATTNALSKRGFLSTRGHVLEGLARATDFVFDKTGTLTEGVFTIRSLTLHSNNMSEAQVRLIAATLESQSEHPIASAFKMKVQLLPCKEVLVHPNLGIEGEVGGDYYYLGNHQFIHNNIGPFKLATNNSNDDTMVILATRTEVIAQFSLEDKLRPNALYTIRSLIDRGYIVHLLSGDNQHTVCRYAMLLGIKSWQAELSPQDKLSYVKNLQQHGGQVIMLGDGINDAPVLMQAQVSIAMANAADLARVNADAVLMNNDLSVLLLVTTQVKRTQSIIKQCLIWAVLYNIVCLPMAVNGLVAPYLAAILMSLSSILVVGNAMRLMNTKPLIKRLSKQMQLISAIT